MDAAEIDHFPDSTDRFGGDSECTGVSKIIPAHSVRPDTGTNRVDLSYFLLRLCLQ